MTRTAILEPSGFGVRVPGGVLPSRSGPVHTAPALTSGTVYGRVSRPRRHLLRAVALGSEILLAVLAAVAYGVLVGLGHDLAVEWDRPNLAVKGTLLAAIFGVVVAVAWARRIARRADRPKMSRREAESALFILTGLAEMQEHGLLRPDAGTSTTLSSREVTR